MDTFLLRKILPLVIMCYAAAIMGGCAKFGIFKSNKKDTLGEQLKVSESNTTAGRFNARMIFLADQLVRNNDRNRLANTVIITSFTNLNKLTETTSFGRLIAENLIHELQVRKWQVYEIRLSNNITIDDSGEFILSRDINALKAQYKVGGIVTGTYSSVEGDIIVNARVIDMNNGMVISSAQAHFPANWFTDALLFNEENIKPMKIMNKTTEKPIEKPKEGSQQ